MTPSGITFNVQQFSTEDGPGIRTTVFLKGCPLRCAWCHNPEGLRSTPDLVWHDLRCIAARECLKACSQSALQLNPDGMAIDHENCTSCGDCTLDCPSGALELIGRSWTPEALLEFLLKDVVFYETSGGGITFSGGEPVLQVEFLEELLPVCKAHNLHLALDTCGSLPWERYARLLSWIDLVLFDLKLMDPDRHKIATGVDNRGILENARRLGERGLPIWIRTPVIPGYTDDLKNIQAMGTFIRQELPTVERWDLLAYTNLGRPKYHQLDLPYHLEDTPLLTQEDMQAVWSAAVRLVPSARWSGATRPTQFSHPDPQVME